LSKSIRSSRAFQALWWMTRGESALLIALLVFASFWILTHARMFWIEPLRARMIFAAQAIDSKPLGTRDRLSIDGLITYAEKRTGVRLRFHDIGDEAAWVQRAEASLRTLRIESDQSASFKEAQRALDAPDLAKRLMDQAAPDATVLNHLWGDKYRAEGVAFRVPKNGLGPASIRDNARLFLDLTDPNHVSSVSAVYWIMPWKAMAFYDWKWAYMCQHFPIMIYVALLLTGSLMDLRWPTVACINHGRLHFEGDEPERIVLGSTHRNHQRFLKQWLWCSLFFVVVLVGVELRFNTPEIRFERLLNVPVNLLLGVLAGFVVMTGLHTCRLRVTRHQELKHPADKFRLASALKEFDRSLIIAGIGLTVVIIYMLLVANVGRGAYGVTRFIIVLPVILIATVPTVILWIKSRIGNHDLPKLLETMDPVYYPSDCDWTIWKTILIPDSAFSRLVALLLPALGASAAIAGWLAK